MYWQIYQDFLDANIIVHHLSINQLFYFFDTYKVIIVKHMLLVGKLYLSSLPNFCDISESHFGKHNWRLCELSLSCHMCASIFWFYSVWGLKTPKGSRTTSHQQNIHRRSGCLTAGISMTFKNSINLLVNLDNHLVLSGSYLTFKTMTPLIHEVFFFIPLLSILHFIELWWF